MKQKDKVCYNSTLCQFAFILLCEFGNTAKLSKCIFVSMTGTKMGTTVAQYIEYSLRKRCNRGSEYMRYVERERKIKV